MSITQQEKALRFRALHDGPGTFVIPNPWDAGSARMLAGLGFQALATSSGAAAASIGRRDGTLTREEGDVLCENIATRVETEGWSRSSEPSDEREEARQLTDEALIGLALGKRWGDDATALK